VRVFRRKKKQIDTKRDTKATKKRVYTTTTTKIRKMNEKKRCLNLYTKLRVIFH
jgi:hypothetical protein